MFLYCVRNLKKELWTLQQSLSPLYLYLRNTLENSKTKKLQISILKNPILTSSPLTQKRPEELTTSSNVSTFHLSNPPTTLLQRSEGDYDAWEKADPKGFWDNALGEFNGFSNTDVLEDRIDVKICYMNQRDRK